MKKDSFSLSNALSDMLCEKLHLKCLKYILSVHKKTINMAVMGGLGRFPIVIYVLCNSVKYFKGYPLDVQVIYLIMPYKKVVIYMKVRKRAG